MRTEALRIGPECNLSNATGVRFYCTRHGMYIHFCAHCGRAFHAKRSHTLTCSDRCRMAYSRTRR